MNIDNNEIYILANKLISDCFGLNLYTVDRPEELAQTDHFDFGFRKMIWGHTPSTDVFDVYVKNQDHSHIIILHSVLGFYNILVFVNDIETGTHFIIYTNPFLPEVISDVWLESIINSERITNISIHELKYCYNSLPVADPMKICKVLIDVLSINYNEFKSIEPETINFSKSNNAININTFYYNQFSSNNSEAFTTALQDYLKAIENSLTTNASYKSELLIKQYYKMKQESYHNFQHFVMELNSFICERLLCGSIHPHHILTLFYSLEIKIHMSNDREKLISLIHEMTRKYCMLVRNYSNLNYSYLVRNVISHIVTHIDSELSLNSIAKEFDKNSSYLSHVFKEETGVSLTSFIHQERIKAAINLINTTDHSISDIALLVGIEDFAYFSKLFKNQVGCSPRQYKKMLHGDNK